MDDAGIVLLCVAFPVLIIIALVFLVNKTKQQEQQTQQEIEAIVHSLPETSRGTFLMQYNAQKKSPVTAVVLALLLGGIGAHKFYLGQVGMGIVYLLFCWTTIPAIIAFFEAFTLSHTVHKMNKEIARQAGGMLGAVGKVTY